MAADRRLPRHVTACRAAGAAVAAVCAGLAAAACTTAPSVTSQQAKPTARASAPASPADTASPTASDQSVAPLTGLPASRLVASRSAVALVLSGRRPAGLPDADVVYQQATSPTHYLAVYQSRQARGAGPVGSTLPPDGQTAAVLKALVGYDGGTTSFVTILDHTKVTDLGAGTHSSLYASGPAGLTASTRAFRAAAHAPAPPALFPFRGDPGSSQQLASSGQFRASAVTVRIPGHGTQKWSFDSGRNLWRLASGGPRVAVANLIVQTTDYHQVFLDHRAGLTTMTAKVFGKGKFEAFTGTRDSSAQGAGGLAARGSWRKPGLAYVTSYADANGYPMYFQPGPTWVLLAPHGTKISTAEAGA